jgi:hypothetical protein
MQTILPSTFQPRLFNLWLIFWTALAYLTTLSVCIPYTIDYKMINECGVAGRMRTGSWSGSPRRKPGQIATLLNTNTTRLYLGYNPGRWKPVNNFLSYSTALDSTEYTCWHVTSHLMLPAYRVSELPTEVINHRVITRTHKNSSIRWWKVTVSLLHGLVSSI